MQLLRHYKWAVSVYEGGKLSFKAHHYSIPSEFNSVCVCRGVCRKVFFFFFLPIIHCWCAHTWPVGKNLCSSCPTVLWRWCWAGCSATLAVPFSSHTLACLFGLRLHTPAVSGPLTFSSAAYSKRSHRNPNTCLTLPSPTLTFSQCSEGLLWLT